MVVSAACGLCQWAHCGLALKFGVAAVTVVAPVVANSLQWAVDLVAMLEKQLELLQATHIEYVLAAQAAVHKIILELRDSLAMWSIPLRPHTQLAYVPAVATAATAHVFIQ